MTLKLDTVTKSAINNELARLNGELMTHIKDLEAQNSELRNTNTNLINDICSARRDAGEEVESRWREKIKPLEAQLSFFKQANSNLTNDICSVRRGIGEEIEKRWKEKIKPLEAQLSFFKMVNPDIFTSMQAMYKAAMITYPVPPSRCPFRDLEIVQMTKTVEAQLLSRRKWYGKNRHYLYLPKRTIWCESQYQVHLLGFSPMKCYDESYSGHKWLDNTELASKCHGRQEFELFVDYQEEVRYAGIYRVKTLCSPQGSTEMEIPPNISRQEILDTMGLYDDEMIEDSNMKEQFRTSGGEPLVECFGLQCVGFNEELYADLRQTWKRTQPVLIGHSSVAREPPLTRLDGETGRTDIIGATGSYYTANITFPFRTPS
ncbi:hypothetical protein MKEN_01032900 [Mycena kentingensis (nom. inval.)]|nr:hypothetical protein MKEN_01032900 [Mycena kentingensis (nom. inval.)]